MQVVSFRSAVQDSCRDAREIRVRKTASEALDTIDILIFALIAVFLIFRLRSVLGRRTGDEDGRPNPYAGRGQPRIKETDDGGDNVVTLPGRARQQIEETPAVEGNAGLTQIRIADPGFDDREFLRGARMAFGMIVDAYAGSDTETLRPLLSDELFGDFDSAIRDRIEAGETLETRVERIESAEITDARVDDGTAFITVKFVSTQVNLTRDVQGTIIDGSVEPGEATDLWTFARPTSTTDPNWFLVETRTPT